MCVCCNHGPRGFLLALSTILVFLAQALAPAERVWEQDMYKLHQGVGQIETKLLEHEEALDDLAKALGLVRSELASCVAPDGRR